MRSILFILEHCTAPIGIIIELNNKAVNIPLAPREYLSHYKNKFNHNCLYQTHRDRTMKMHMKSLGLEMEGIICPILSRYLPSEIYKIFEKSYFQTCFCNISAFGAPKNKSKNNFQ